MASTTIEQIREEIEGLKKAGTYKVAPVLASAMGPVVKLADGKEVINLCSNNYLGLANHPEVLRGAKEALDKFGNGTASVRFICGTFTIHQELEKTIAALPPIAQKELLDFVGYLQYKHQIGQSGQVIRLGGLWAGVDFDVTDEDVRALRQQVTCQLVGKV